MYLSSVGESNEKLQGLYVFRVRSHVAIVLSWG